MRLQRIAILLAALPAAASAAAPATSAAPAALVLGALAHVCTAPASDPGPIASALGGAAALAPAPVEQAGRTIGSRRDFRLGDGARITVERLAPDGRLRRVSIEYRSAPADGARPLLLVIADGGCRPLTGRRLVYAGPGAAVAIERLDPTLHRVIVRERLDAPVPPGQDPGGVRVAMVDSGVNYTLPVIARRLARDAEGRALGYDWWDMDPRPFDENPAASPFFPQRHGTRTASLLLEDAPVASLVPYRYPRPDMKRMSDLVDAAARADARIVNVSLGSRKRDEWLAFADAARAHPELLFVVSAGNDGVDIDRHPVWPAAFALANVLTVTSAEDSGTLAPGSNWGPRSVDLMVPAERQVMIGFHGYPVVRSGSSYAAARVSALAACLLAGDPGLDTAGLRKAILARAVAPRPGARRVTAAGFLPDPVASQRGACQAEPARIRVTGHDEWHPDRAAAPPGAGWLALEPTLVLIADTGWTDDAMREATARAVEILAQCRIDVPKAPIIDVETPRRYRYLRNDFATTLLSRVPVPRPAVVFLADTVQAEPFEAEAVGRANARGRPDMLDTVWLTAGVSNPGVALAHELFHVIADSGAHHPDPGNLMHERTSRTGIMLTRSQCALARRRGVAQALLKPLR